MRGNIERQTSNAERRTSTRAFRPSIFSVRRSAFSVPLILTSAICLLAALTGCRRDMFLQPSEKPLEHSQFFRDNEMASRPLPAHTVARGQLDEDQAFYTGMIGTNLITEFPMPITREVLLRGQERFDIYCAPCHGKLGDGNGITKKLNVMPTVANLHDKRLVGMTDGEIFNTITVGKSTMAAVGPLLPAQDRWAVIAYLRALQLSQLGTKEDLTPAQAATLK